MRISLSIPVMVVLGAVVLLSGCGPSRPSQQEVLSALNDNLPISDPYAISSVTPEYFPQNDGSLLIKGTAAGSLKENLYTIVSFDGWLKELGFDALAWNAAVAQAQALRPPYRDAVLASFPRDGRQPLLIRLTASAGTETTFNFQTVAHKGDSNWAFDSIILLPQNRPAGQTLAQFSGALVVGSPDEQSATGQFLNARKAFTDALGQAQKAIAGEDEQTRKTYAAATIATKTYVGSLTIGAEVTPVGFKIITQQAASGIQITGYIFAPSDPSIQKPFSGTVVVDPVRSGGLPLKIQTDYQSGAPKVSSYSLFAPLRSDTFQLRVSPSGLDGKQGEGNPVALTAQ